MQQDCRLTVVYMQQDCQLTVMTCVQATGLSVDGYDVLCQRALYNSAKVKSTHFWYRAVQL